MPLNPSQVLVVDDDPFIREFVQAGLTDEGYDVVTAEHGRDALRVLGHADCDPSLILLDMRMPEMDGWEFAVTYREQHTPRAPIVVVTAAQDARQYASQVSADGVLPKPFDLDELFSVVARFAHPNSSAAADGGYSNSTGVP